MVAGSEPVAFVGAWQPVERFSRDRIQRFQQVLVSQGYDVGKVDGLSGFKTRRSIGLAEKKRGLPLTCYPSSKLLDAVLKEAETPQ
jgi:peptidoglycan hydrolase-like protein with peptidoglycan-binding domain